MKLKRSPIDVFDNWVKIGKDDGLGVLIALVTPLLLFQGMPVEFGLNALKILNPACLLYTSPSPRDRG